MGERVESKNQTRNVVTLQFLWTLLWSTKVMTSLQATSATRCLLYISLQVWKMDSFYETVEKWKLWFGYTTIVNNLICKALWKVNEDDVTPVYLGNTKTKHGKWEYFISGLRNSQRQVKWSEIWLIAAHHQRPHDPLVHGTQQGTLNLESYNLQSLSVIVAVALPGFPITPPSGWESVSRKNSLCSTKSSSDIVNWMVILSSLALNVICWLIGW